MKVIIKGCAPAPMPMVDLLHRWQGDDVLVWGLNKQDFTWAAGHDGWQGNHKLEWFQLHGLGHMVEAHGEDYLVWLSGLDCPLYMFQDQIYRWPGFVNTELKIDIPLPENPIAYPVEKAVQLAGREYITNSFSWMTALAILKGATHIHLTGITLGDDTKELWSSRGMAANFIDDFLSGSSIAQYTQEDMAKVTNDLRGIGAGDESWIIPNLEYWVGIARGRGIEFTVDGGNLFYDKWDGLYGLHGGGEY